MADKPFIEIKADFNVLKASLTEIGRKALPVTIAKTLTFLAKNVEKKTYDAMRANFDRPTPIVMRSLRTKTATVRDQHARVYLKGYELTKQAKSIADVLSHEFEGGARIPKQLEKRFRQAGLLGQDEWFAPGLMARMDKYGNMSRGQIQQVISQLGLMVAGSDSAATKSGKSQRSQRRAGYFFWSDGDKIDLKRGVWQAKSGGRDLNPILIAVRKPNYRALIDMDKIEREEREQNAVAIFERVFKKETGEK